MHGDNSGMYRASRLIAEMFAYIGDDKKSEYWKEKALHFRNTANKICWNGRFYTHQVHINPIEIKGLDESKQLSLSNPYDINRGLPDHRMAVSIIKEYQYRRKHVDSFAEWFSIDPCFPP